MIIYCEGVKCVMFIMDMAGRTQILNTATSLILMGKS